MIKDVLTNSGSRSTRSRHFWMPIVNSESRPIIRDIPLAESCLSPDQLTVFVSMLEQRKMSLSCLNGFRSGPPHLALHLAREETKEIS